MAPIFASPDIATLVAAYPPSQPTRTTTSLVRTYSKSRLVRSDYALKKFDRLLETNDDRIKVVDLPRRLGIESVDWILDGHDQTIFYSSDGRSLVPRLCIQDTIEDLSDRLNSSFVNFSAFALEHELSRELAEEIHHSGRSPEIYSFEDASSRWIVRNAHLSEIRQKIRDSLIKAASQRVELSALFVEVPTFILKQLVQEIQRSEDEVEGCLEESGRRLVFVPSKYTSLQEEKTKSERAEMIKAHVHAFISDGYCIVERSVTSKNDPLVEIERATAEICTAIKNEQPDYELATLPNPTQHVVVITTDGKVMDMVEALQQGAIKHVQDREGALEKVFDHEEAQKLVSSSSQPLLAAATLQDGNHFKAVASAYDTARELAIEAEASAFEELVRANIAAPLQLYTTGIAEVDDKTLAEHLEAYVLDHFIRDQIPQTVIAAQGQALLRNKARSRDFEKFGQVSKDSKSLADIQSAVTRLFRKQKVDAPTTEQIDACKLSTLEQKAKSVQRMTRGSDVLQNLIWILLARRLSGLFMSSGKDTSRMIKLYERVGDETLAMKLVRWRDALKASGNLDGAEMQEMKAMGLP